jgi:hypothetical protein
MKMIIGTYPMKLARLALAFGLPAFAVALFQPATAAAQGALTPPGPPAPTMKSLDQIEARTPISSAPFTIAAPGSYYLTTNLAVSSGNGITIVANNVTLDLNGFTISSTESAPTGVGIQLGTISGLKNIAILNGVIVGGVTNTGGVYSGSGFGYGISDFSGNSVSVRVTGVSVSGCLYSGINLPLYGTMVNSCTVGTLGGYGIKAQSVSDSTARNCGAYGIYAYTADNCWSQCIGGWSGLFATTADNCYGLSSSGRGLDATVANSCYGTSSSGTGLDASTANNCYGNSSGGTGLNVITANNCCGFSSTGGGLYADTANNCRGSSSGSGYGLYASYLAMGCVGSSTSGTGLYAFNANNCIGQTGSVSPSQFGLYAYDIAIGCYGSSGAGGIGIYGIVLNSCGGTSLSYSFKYNMP